MAVAVAELNKQMAGKKVKEVESGLRKSLQGKIHDKYLLTSSWYKEIPKSWRRFQR